MYDENYIRGSIRHKDRYKQLISFEGLERHRHITPMDIDGFIDYAGNAFLYMECKHEDVYNEKGLDVGQKRAIENLVNANRDAYKIAMAIVFTHRCMVEEIIMAKDMPVREFYWDHKWAIPHTDITVLQVIERFENYCKGKNIYI